MVNSIDIWEKNLVKGLETKFKVKDKILKFKRLSMNPSGSWIEIEDINGGS